MIVYGARWTLEGLVFTPEGTGEQGIPGTFDNGTLLVLSPLSSDIIIDRCTFTSQADVSRWSVADWRAHVWSGIRADGPGHLVKNNHLVHVAFALQLAEGCTNAIVERNTIEEFSGDGIRIAGADHCTIRNNIVRNSVELDSNTTVGNHEDGIQGWGDIIGLRVSGNLVTNDNVSERPLRGFMQGIVTFDGSSTECVYENNVVLTEHWHGITVFGAYRCTIVNNTVLAFPGSGPYEIGPPWINISPRKDGTPSVGNLVRNNLTTALALESSALTRDHNVVDRYAEDFLEDCLHHDFRPKPGFTKNGVAIIDVGSPSEAPPVDFNGLARPQGNGIDIGACESPASTAIGIIPFPDRVASFSLSGNYPNPFNSETRIRVSIPERTHVTLDVFSVLGAHIARLIDRELSPGVVEVTWDASSPVPVGSGVYLVALSAGRFHAAKRMVVIK
jgi:parallel beta-helix repeat protein